MLRNLAILLLLVSAWVAGPVSAHAKDKLQKRDGDYNISVAGYVKGQGYATVTASQVRLQANVVSDSGEKGELNASALTITGTHFSGTGNVLGHQATFSGRLDAPDSDKEKTIKGVRLVCTVKTDEGKYSRVVGYIPALAAATSSDDDDRDRGRGKGK